jgi:hypothetical protein
MGPFRAPREAGDGRRPPTLIIKESECPVQETESVTASSSVPSAMPTARRGYADMGANLASPSLSEFEHYLDEREANLQQKTITKGSVEHVPYERPPNVSNAEWWELVLAAEKERCEQETRSRTIDVADILLHDSSSDDDIPIVSTLPVAKAKRKVPKKKASLWTYETVHEPTGAASRYWDAEAPSERATKRLAKIKLSSIDAQEDLSSGSNPP